MKQNSKSKILIGIVFLSIIFLITGCSSIESSKDLEESNTNTDSGSESSDSNSQNNADSTSTNTNTGSSTGSNVQVDTRKLPDVVLEDLKIYDLSTKKYIEIGSPIIAGNPFEVSVTLKNIGNAPYAGPKGNAPVQIFMITDASTEDLYFYSNNYTALNPGEERVFKTNVLKLRAIGSHNTTIYPNIQQISTQPEELSKDNNVINMQLVIQSK